MDSPELTLIIAVNQNTIYDQKECVTFKGMVHLKIKMQKVSYMFRVTCKGFFFLLKKLNKNPILHIQ